MKGLELRENRIKKITNIFTMEIILLILSFMETKFLLNLHNINLKELATVTFSPINGHAMWRAFQNRLLPAEIMSLIDSNSVVNSYEIFMLVFTFICNILLFILFSRYSYKKALMMTLLFILLFILSQDKMWLYGWDFIDVAITILVLIGIDRSLSIWYFVCIFAVAILNRESAIFIPLWLFISAFPKNKKRIIASLVLMVIGVALTYYLRTLLFKGSIDHAVGLDKLHNIWGNPVYLSYNFYYLLIYPFVISNLKYSNYSIIPAVVVITYLFCILRWRNKQIRDVLIYSGIMILAILVFGYISETRIWLPLIPALLYMLKDRLWEDKLIEPANIAAQ